MNVVVVRSFACWIDGNTHRYSDGDVIRMPDGADWLDKGLVALVEGAGRETAEAPKAEEKATAPQTRRRSTRRSKK